MSSCGWPPQQNRGQTLSLIITDDCSWEKQAQAAVNTGLAAFHSWKHVLKNPHLDTATKLHSIGTFIKPCITRYGGVGAHRLQQAIKCLRN
jgi:hypothetical protein